MTRKYKISLHGTFFQKFGVFAKSWIQQRLIAVLIRLVSQIKVTLLLKIQWKQRHILYVKIVYKQNMMH
jgi:hypothetical protein